MSLKSSSTEMESLCRYATIYLSILPQMDIGLFLNLSQLEIMLLQKLLYESE